MVAALGIYAFFWFFGVCALVAYWIERPYWTLDALDMLEEKTEKWRVYNYQQVLWYMIQFVLAGFILVVITVDWLIQER